MAKFSVDTKLFRELGELLVGRDSTALVELVKNAYDADATRVRVHGERLGDHEAGVIVIEDDGIGMDVDTFKRGFLTIAGRTKTSGLKTSPLFGRRFTGEKGVGRLSAHKLASHLEVRSRSWNGKRKRSPDGLQSDVGMHGVIDWNAIEQRETFDQISDTDVSIKQLRSTGAAGTRLTLTQLRRKWTKRAFEDFFSDVATLVPSPVLSQPLPSDFASGRAAFVEPTVRTSAEDDPGFKIEYSGDFSTADSDIPSVVEAAFWIIEIDCDADRRSVRISVRPTTTALRNDKFKNAESWFGTLKIPKSQPAISFNARILEKEGSEWPRRFQGVKVYLEGFRIPPYGDSSNDWLELDREYRRRGRGELLRLRRFSNWQAPDGDELEGLDVKGNSHYFGAVFLTRNNSGPLQMLVNREGFLPDENWESIVDVVRWAIGVQVRQRTMTRLPNRAARTAEQVNERRQAASSADDSTSPSVFEARREQAEAMRSVREIRAAIDSGRPAVAQEKLNQLDQQLRNADRVMSDHATEATMYRVLASVGLEQAAFVHEILGLALSAEAIATALERLSSTAVDADTKRRLKLLVVEAKDLRERLRRNGVYLTEMTGIEGRKRRTRLKLKARLEKVLLFFEASAEKREVEVANEIPDALVSPPMFPAEVSALFSNLLSNAIKFAGTPGRVKVSGETTENEVIVRIENTGLKVDPHDGEKWFDPFRSTTAQADPTLGQGMGLGLTVSRSLMDEYGGVIQFVRPTRGFVTAIEVRWPKK